MTTWLLSLQMHEILLYGLVFGLPIVAIGFSSIETIIKAFMKHHERLAMIGQGLDPDDYREGAGLEECPAAWPGSMDETQAYVPQKGQIGSES